MSAWNKNILNENIDEEFDKNNEEEDVDYANGTGRGLNSTQVSYHKIKSSKIIKWVNFERSNELGYKMKW